MKKKIKAPMDHAGTVKMIRKRFSSYFDLAYANSFIENALYGHIFMTEFLKKKLQDFFSSKDTNFMFLITFFLVIFNIMFYVFPNKYENHLTRCTTYILSHTYCLYNQWRKSEASQKVHLLLMTRDLHSKIDRFSPWSLRNKWAVSIHATDN